MKRKTEGGGESTQPTAIFSSSCSLPTHLQSAATSDKKKSNPSKWSAMDTRVIKNHLVSQWINVQNLTLITINML